MNYYLGIWSVSLVSRPFFCLAIFVAAGIIKFACFKPSTHTAYTRILKYISHVYHFPSPFSVLFHKELLYGSSIFHNICLTCPKQAKYLSLPNEFHSKMGKNKKDFWG